MTPEERLAEFNKKYIELVRACGVELVIRKTTIIGLNGSAPPSVELIAAVIESWQEAKEPEE